MALQQELEERDKLIEVIFFISIHFTKIILILFIYINY